MRLRKKAWVPDALQEFKDIVLMRKLIASYDRETGVRAQEVLAEEGKALKGHWAELFGRKAPLHVELGTGKGRFISQLAQQYPAVNFVGIEAQQDVLYYVAEKIEELKLSNVRLLVFDGSHLTEIFAAGEIDRLYINFCDPWPKERHAKRRLTHAGFLEKYRQVLKPDGDILFKTDNRALFDFSLEQFKELGLHVDQLTFDLHADNPPDNIMTEYEAKFSSRGIKINRCRITFP